MLRIVFAVLTGYITAVTLAFFTGIGLFVGMTPKAFVYFVMLTEFPWGFAGGYVAARIAEKNEYVATVGLMALSMTAGIIAIAFQPPSRRVIWQSMVTLVLLMAGEFAGGYLRLRQTNKLVR